MATLPISELKNATNISSHTIKTASGVVGTPPDDIKLSEFKVASILSLSVNVYDIPFNGSFTTTLFFTGEQQYFNRIKTISSNYIATINNTRLSLLSEASNQKTFKNTYNPQGTGGGTSIIEPVKVKFFDKGYNEDCVNYNTDFTVNVKLYTPPKPIISFASSTRPPRPCCGVVTGWSGPCCNATITINFSTPANLGVTSSNISIYYSTNNVNFTLHSTNFNSSGQVTIGGLAGNTLYYIKAINNFNCSSETITATTLAYV
jgi:hypothetical protein